MTRQPFHFINISDYAESGSGEFDSNNGEVAFSDLTSRKKSKTQYNKEYRERTNVNRGYKLKHG